MSNLYSDNEVNKGTKINYILNVIKKPIFLLIIIGIISVIIRFYYLSFDVPIIYDGIDYFSYAIVTSQQGQLPTGWGLSNNGWPIFLSFFFSIFDSQNILELMYLQRVLTIIISVLTIIPVYLLCNRFIDKKFTIIGAAFFAFDPRIIINSLLGITEPSFILLGTLSLFLFLSKRYTIILMSFMTLGLFSIIRYEGFLILIPFLIIFLIRFRKDKKVIPKIFLLVGIFFLTIIPIVYSTYEATGTDGIVSPIFGGGIDYVSHHIIGGVPDVDDSIYGENNQQNRFSLFLSLGIINTIKFFGWVLIPIFIVFVPVGFFLFFQKKDYKTFTVIIFGITILIPAFYAYGRGIEETRYLYIIFPILCLMSSLTVKKICTKLKKDNLIIIFIISAILLSSILFLDYKKIDYEYEKESYLIAQDIEEIASGINHWSQWKYIPVSEISNNWPKIPLPTKNGYDQEIEMKRVDAKNYPTLINYLKESKDKGLTHIVVDGKQQSEFLNDIFYGKKEFSYLIKEYDSKDRGYQYHVKMYKIDYEIFLKISTKN